MLSLDDPLPQSGPADLKRKLAVNLGWVAGLQLGQRALELLFTAVLARLLMPADFGVVAAAMVFVQLAQLLVEIGIGATLVQLRDLTRRDLRAANTLLVLTALGYCLTVMAIAPWIGTAMRLEAVTPVLRALSLIFVIQAFGIVSESLLVRRLEARKVMAVQFAAKVTGTGMIGIALALLGFNYWALVAASLTEALVKAVALVAIVRPPFVPLFARAEAARLLRRGSGFSVSRLLNFAATSGDKALVGRYLDAASLGLYSRAYNLMSLPADLYGTIAERLVFPALAQVQDDVPRLRRAYLQGTELTALAGIPLSLLLFLLAPEIIDLVLGDRWHGVIIPFAVLAAATYFRLGAKVSGSVQRARGAFRAMVVTQAIYAAMVVGGCFLAFRYGIVGVAAVISAGVAIFFLIITWNSCRLVNASLGAFLRAHLPGFALGGVTASVCWGIATAARGAGLGAFSTLASVGVALAALGAAIILTRPHWLIGTIGIGLADRCRAFAMGLIRRGPGIIR